MAGLLGLLLGLCPRLAQAQAPAWQAAQAIDQLLDGEMQVKGTAVNAAGDVFVTGFFTGQAGFGATVLTSAGGRDAFVAKWSATSQAWAWAVAAGGTGYDQATSIALDGADIYLTGSIVNTSANASNVQFGGQPLSGASSTNSGDVFVAKYTDAGSSATYSWATAGGGTSYDHGSSIAATGSGVYVGINVGSTSPAGNATFGSLAPVSQGSAGFGQLDAATGTWQAAAFSQLAGSSTAEVRGLALNAAGDILVAGTYTGRAGFGGTLLTSTNGFGGDAFVAKWSATSQAWGWAVSGGGTGADQANAIAVSGANVYITGSFTNSNTDANQVKFGGVALPGVGSSPSRLSDPSSDVFLVKYTDAGSSASCNWATAGGGSNSDQGNGIAVSGPSVYITGEFVDNAYGWYYANFGNAALRGVAVVDGPQQPPFDVFVAKYTDAGSSATYNWAKAGGGQSYDYGTSLAVNGASVYMGLYQSGEPYKAQPYGGFGSLPPVIDRTGGFGRLDAATGTWQAVAINRRGGTAQVNGAAVNAAGDVLVAGTYTGQAGFGGTLLTSKGGTDAFVAKWSKARQAWDWATTGGGRLSDGASAIAVSGQSVYVTGTFTGTGSNQTEVRFGGFPLVSGVASDYVGDKSVYVAKYTDAGSSAVGNWATNANQLGADYNTQVQAIAANGSSIYLLQRGHTYGYTLNKYTDTGSGINNVWNVGAYSSARDSFSANSIAVSGPSVYVAGTFVNSNTNINNVTFGGIPLNGASSATSADVFVAKCTDAGSSATVSWATVGGGTGADRASGIAVSGQSVYVTGAITNTSANASGVQFGGTALNGASATSSSDVFVAKYTDAGSSATYNWGTVGGGTGADQANGIAVSGSSLYVTGAITNTSANASGVQFGGTALNGASATSSSDVFVAKYTDAGSSATYNWATAGGGTGADQANGIALSGSSLYVGGYAALPATFGTLQLPGFNNNVAFLAVLPVTVNLVVGTGTVAAPTSIVAGTYNNITVTSTGNAVLAGGVTVEGSLDVQAGGSLNTNCQALTGAGSFTLAAGATLGICDAAGITASGATGAVQLAGSRSYASDASYTYNGVAAQVTGSGLPSQVRNLTVSNAAGLNLSQAVSVAQVARLQSGDLATSGQSFTLLSAAAGTALVDNSGGGVITGTGTMQRAVTNAVAGPAYRHFSSPVANTTLGDLATPGFSPVFNPDYNSSATPSTVTPFPTVFGYDQDRIASVTSTYSAFDIGWFSPAGPSTVMQPTRGYTVNAPATPTPIDFVGTFNNAAQNSGALNRSSSPQAGWQLLGNPYPSPLDWSTVTLGQRPGMDAALYVYQSTGQYAGNYRSYANGVGVSPLIAAGSGYFARVTTPGTPGAVNLTNANRVTDFGAQPAFGRGAADTRPRLHLLLAGAGLTDETFLYMQAGATAGVDAQYDALKLPNPSGLNLSSTVGTAQLAIDGRPVPTAAAVLPLAVGVPTAGTYTLTAAAFDNMPAGLEGYLRDAQTGQILKLSVGTTHSFSITTAQAQAPVLGRFTLLFGPQAVLATASALSAEVVTVYPNPAHGSFTVVVPGVAGARSMQATLLNALGQQVLARTLPLSAAGAVAEFSTANLAAGVYTMQLRADESVVTKRVVVE